ncbi:DUF3352 domain-containing protein [Synechococcus sp. J7-Johnson]|uniref:DUF3352 domain-containing protein n=1 Tax=Synechococcus sp. J7-Johnson TaxID=2823737 RepID=UPI0020CEA369|nr:DUF3352 domain-containing protein [Synechococcus sp. J7-Johnson]MCP9840577.1 DUF3352 domain-containing protein [Synechococcus sp. J7-Johnson]
MKARPFLAAVLTAALLLLSLGGGFWWLALRQSPLHLEQQPLHLPLAARFVPRSALLSLHLLVKPDDLVAYARAVAPPPQRREAAELMTNLRDGAFATAGLAYTSELAGWLGPDTTLAVIAPEGSGGPSGWLLALGCREPEGARLFLQRFWQSRSLAGTALQISSYRGMGLISGRGALAGESSQPLATALIDDQLVLIASGRGVLEQALDVSQIEELNQAGQHSLQAAVGRLEKGVALLTARPQAFSDWLDLPTTLKGAEGVGDLVVTLIPDGRSLQLQALLPVRQQLQQLQLDPLPDLPAQLRGPVASLALIQDPASLLAEPGEQASSDLWNDLVGPLLRQALAQLNGPLPSLVAAANHGPLLGLRREGGWMLATAASPLATEQLSPPLLQQGYSPAPLSRAGQTLQVWSRLEARSGKGDPDRLQATLAGARLDQGETSWWSEGLAALDDQLQGRQPPPRERIEQLQALGSRGAPLQAALAAGPAQALLAPWHPWQLVSSLVGRPLLVGVQGLAFSLAIEPPLPEDSPPPLGPSSLLALRARLELG